MLKVSSVCSVGSFSLWLLCPHFGSKSLCHILSVIILPRFTQEWTIHPRLCSCHPSRALTNGSWPLLKPSPYPAWSLTGHLYIILFQGFASMWSSLDFLRARWLRVVWLLMWWLKVSTVIIPGSKVEGVGWSRWLRDKESACQCRRHRRCGFCPCVGKIPRRRNW